MCREKSNNRLFVLRREKSKDFWTFDVTIADAMKTFRSRTGIQLVHEAEDGSELDAEVACLILSVRGALESAEPEQEKRTRGRPRRSRELDEALTVLVDRFGPTDAALVLFILGVSAHPNFPLAIAKNLSHGQDVRAVLRQAGKHLSAIAREYRSSSSEKGNRKREHYETRRTS